jgi:hypothetical protein
MVDQDLVAAARQGQFLRRRSREGAALGLGHHEGALLHAAEAQVDVPQLRERAFGDRSAVRIGPRLGQLPGLLEPGDRPSERAFPPIAHRQVQEQGSAVRTVRMRLEEGPDGVLAPAPARLEASHQRPSEELVLRAVRLRAEGDHWLPEHPCRADLRIGGHRREPRHRRRTLDRRDL